MTTAIYQSLLPGSLDREACSGVRVWQRPPLPPPAPARSARRDVGGGGGSRGPGARGGGVSQRHMIHPLVNGVNMY